MLQFDDVSRVLTVAPQGELDHCMAERIRNTIDATVLKTDAKVVVFDLSEVGFMDSSGIGMMIGRYKFMKRRGGGCACAACASRWSAYSACPGLARSSKTRKGRRANEHRQ